MDEIGDFPGRRKIAKPSSLPMHSISLGERRSKLAESSAKRNFRSVQELPFGATSQEVERLPTATGSPAKRGDPNETKFTPVKLRIWESSEGHARERERASAHSPPPIRFDQYEVFSSFSYILIVSLSLSLFCRCCKLYRDKRKKVLLVRSVPLALQNHRKKNLGVGPRKCLGDQSRKTRHRCNPITLHDISVME